MDRGLTQGPSAAVLPRARPRCPVGGSRASGTVGGSRASGTVGGSRAPGTVDAPSANPDKLRAVTSDRAQNHDAVRQDTGMQVVVTGALGKVGRFAAAALQDAGDEVLAVDLARPTYERADPGAARYLGAGLTDPGDAFAAVPGADAVVHAAAIPEPTQDPPHTVFRTNATWARRCATRRC
jgi:hypothetical protein